VPAADDYALALALTLVLEVPVWTALLVRPGGVRARAALRTAALVNVVSHPLAFLAGYPLLRGPLGDGPALVAVEVAVLVGEAAVAARRHGDVVAAVVASAVANVLSLTLGVVLLG